MRHALWVATAIVLAAGTAAAVDFTFDSGAEGWITSGAAVGVGSSGATDGVLWMNYATPTGPFDPMFIGPTVSIDAAREHWLVLDVNLTAIPSAANQVFQLFFVNEFSGYIESQSRLFWVTPNIGMTRIVFDLLPEQGGRDPWRGTVSAFRIDPGNSEADLVGYRCELDRIRITSDTDEDGIPDDAEYDYWGDLVSADGTTDHDANGISDAAEIAFGLDPTDDEGEQLPTLVVWALFILTALIALAGTRVIRARRYRRRSHTA